MSSKPFFTKSLKKLVKAFSKEVVEKTGRHLFQIGDFLIIISMAFAGILDKVGRWEVILVFCSALPGFFVPESKKGILVS